MNKENKNFKYDNKNGVYWQDGDRTPYCQACWEGQDKLAFHLTKKPYFTNDYESITYECKRCKAGYEISRKDVKDLQ